MNEHKDEVNALVVLLTLAAQRVGIPLAGIVVRGLADVFGSALLRGELDVWEAAQAPSDALFRKKFGVDP